MPYPLSPGMTKQDFKREILEYYFPDLCMGANAAYADDYAAIGAFLTRLDEVKAALKPLEEKLRQLALANAALAAAGGPLPAHNASLYNRKEVTRKILSGALADVEMRAGFNGAAAGLLHNESVFGTGSGNQIDLTTQGRTTNGVRAGATDVNLPRGVPKVIGSIHPTDFMVLLKHGYACKDVGAESAHGEFTHRLQWYAIIQAKGSINLSKEPIDLYKKMWFGFTKGTANIASKRSLYMWMALVDNVTSDKEAANIGTMAWSPKTFNNPEFMNSSLTPIVGPAFDVMDSANLFVLGKLLRARKTKRSLGFDGTTNYHAKKMTDTGANKTVLAGKNATGPTSLADLKNVVAWIDSI